MNCEKFEPEIALYVEGDLDGREAAGVREHLAGCAACRELVDELMTSQAALKQLRAQPVDAALLAAVRSEVLAGIEDRSRARWPWVAAAIAVAAVLIAMFRPAPPPARIVQAPVAQVRVNPTLPGRRPKLAKVRRRRPAPGPPLVVKMFTDDPNIVIIWLVDQTGD
jgi:anti-sigma factor RsiW